MVRFLMLLRKKAFVYKLKPVPVQLIYALVGVVTNTVRKIVKRREPRTIPSWEGVGRGFYTKLLRMINSGTLVRETPTFPSPRKKSHRPLLYFNSSDFGDNTNIGGVLSQQIKTCTLKNGGNCSCLYNFEVGKDISFAD
jgi:hypothetical protein